MAFSTSSSTASDLAASGRSVAHRMVKRRAREYARQPCALDTLHPGLSAAPPSTLIAIAGDLAERERQSPRRWLGFGGEINLINVRAALLLGRMRRRACMKWCCGKAPHGSRKRLSPEPKREGLVLRTHSLNLDRHA